MFPFFLEKATPPVPKTLERNALSPATLTALAGARIAFKLNAVFVYGTSSHGSYRSLKVLLQGQSVYGFLYLST